MDPSSGSRVLRGAVPTKEATVAQKLREAGAIILGTSNLSEFANLRYNNSVSNWSPRGGQCYGAFCENMKASGSSSGSAVATTLGLAFAGIGTEVWFLSYLDHSVNY